MGSPLETYVNIRWMGDEETATLKEKRGQMRQWWFMLMAELEDHDKSWW